MNHIDLILTQMHKNSPKIAYGLLVNARSGICLDKGVNSRLPKYIEHKKLLSVVVVFSANQNPFYF